MWKDYLWKIGEQDMHKSQKGIQWFHRPPGRHGCSSAVCLDRSGKETTMGDTIRRLAKAYRGVRAATALLVVLITGGIIGSPVAAQPGPSLRITNPGNSETVSSPVTVRVDVQNANLRPAEAGDQTSQHLHYFVDIDPATVLQPGQPIPTGRENIIHTADTSQTLTLGPGQHTIWVILSDLGHVPLSPSVQAQVTFTVSGAQVTPDAVPRTGAGGQLSDASGGYRAALVGTATIALAVIVSVLWLRQATKV